MVTLGEGWHNNHHHYPAAARNGFFWWEIDITYYMLKVLEAVGIIWDLRKVPAQLLDEGLLKGREVGQRGVAVVARARAMASAPAIAVADALRSSDGSSGVVSGLSDLVRDAVMDPHNPVGDPEPS
jgi:hypothetical protein